MKKRILIGCPTSSHKDYCLNEWANKILTIYHVAKVNHEVAILIVDNTINDCRGQAHCEKIKNAFKDKDIEANVQVISHWNKDIPLRNLMAECNNIISDIVLKYNFDYLMSIESDIFPPNNCIQFLLDRKPNAKKIVAFPYFLFKSLESKSIMFETEDFGSERLCVPVDLDFIFYKTDGNLHKAEQLGLGCALIHRNILKKIPFRIDESDKKGTHADSFFYEDCRKIGIKLYFDKSNYCIHKNGDWSNIKQ